MSVLQIRNLSKAYGGVQAVSNVSFSVAAGELLALIGPNGAGKTTCFNMLNGQIAADAGTVEFEGRNLAALLSLQPGVTSTGEVIGARTFQITATFASMTVRENVQMALLSHYKRLGSFASIATRACVDEADALLERVGMLAQAGRSCAVLAYGDLKRIELAVALANQPRLLLMDEPTAGMAPRERNALMQLAADLARDSNIAVLFTEHDMDVVFAHADRIIVLAGGELIAEGRPDEVRAHPKVREVYLGTGSTFGAAHA